MVNAPASSCIEGRSGCAEVFSLCTSVFRETASEWDSNNISRLWGWYWVIWKLESCVPMTMCETATWLASGVRARSRHAYSTLKAQYARLKTLRPYTNPAECWWSCSGNIEVELKSNNNWAWKELEICLNYANPPKNNCILLKEVFCIWTNIWTSEVICRNLEEAAYVEF